MKRMLSKWTALGVIAVAALAAVAVATAARAASYQVCVLLPDTKSSVRWVQFDTPDIAKALKAAGVTYNITNALNDPVRQKSQAAACLAAGAKVVIETALDNGSASSCRRTRTPASTS